MSVRRRRIARVSTVPFFVVTQLASQVDALIESGYDVTVVTSDDPLAEPLKRHAGLQFVPVDIPRDISPLRDFRALWRLWRLFRAERYDIVHSTTPKAGLLCALAGALAGVSVRLHTYTGQPWVSLSGGKQHIARLCDTIIGRLNTACYADSASQREFLISERIVRRERISVVGEGSLAGVDLRRFDARRFDVFARAALRARLGIGSSAKVLLFVGRVTRDKGVAELDLAFHKLVDEGIDAHLVVIGPFEPDGEAIFPHALRDDSSRVKLLGYQSCPEMFMAIADVFCLPSYREGFGTVVIEAAAMGVPTVGTNIYGLSDAVIDGETGLLVRPGDSQALFHALRRLLDDDDLRTRLGDNALRRARDAFSSHLVNAQLIDEYKRLSNDFMAPMHRGSA